MSVEEHEAAHAGMAVWLQRPVAYVWRDVGSALPGETVGHVRAPIQDKVEPSQLAIAIVGYMAEGDPDWPPPYDEACTERLEALGKIIEILDLDRDQYDRIVAVTKEILDDPDFRRLVHTIARAHAACPRLDAQAVRELTAAAGIPLPEGVPTWST